MEGNNIQINQNGIRNLTMKIDGVDIKGIESVKFETSICEIPMINLRFTPFDVDLEINSKRK